MKEIFILIKKDFLLEWRTGQAFSAGLLYVLSTAYIVFLSFISIAPSVWNPLYWVIILFVSINALSNSFFHESGNSRLYYYTLTNPLKILAAKICYNTLILTFLSMLSAWIFMFITGIQVRHFFSFLGVIFLASIGFSITLTFTSAIAALSSKRYVLMAILSFPLLIPTLMIVLKLSAVSIGLISDTANQTDILILGALDLLLIGISILLFPFLWKD
jgi:heme exporter protein B